MADPKTPQNPKGRRELKHLPRQRETKTSMKTATPATPEYETLVELADLMQRAGRVFATIDLSPGTAVYLHGLLKLAQRQPDLHPGPDRVAEQFITMIEARLRKLGASEELIRKIA
jgi:hypothetical protein